MNLDANSLLASLLVGSVGLVLFMYGRRQSRFPQIAVGIAMMIYPYFVPSVPIMLAIGAVACAALWGAVRLGW